MQTETQAEYLETQIAPANRNETPQVCRIRARVAARAALIRQTGPAPLILKPAVCGKGAA